MLSDPARTHVIAPNLKRRLSGVTTSIIQLIPVQNRIGQQIAVFGPGLPDSLPRLRFRDLPRLWRKPQGRKLRIWHARRNVEMLMGLVLRDILRMPVKLVFTSASQRVHTAWTRFLIARMDGVIATSHKTSSYLKVPHRVSLHGINAERFSPAADRNEVRSALSLPREQKLAGCFGRIRHQKGTDVFVDAMIRLLPSRPGWSAIVAGRATASHGGYLTELKARVAAADLADRILFVGEHTKINEWYRALDLFVAPQRWEGFGLTPLEAQASGVPVVATDVGAFEEIIARGADETGLVVPKDDLDALSSAAAAFMDDDPRRSAAAERARPFVLANFTIESEAERLSATYEEVWRKFDA
ncbi:glycosyltransferase family 4 protein [uncultured Hoeflea sp.]|uniref:glycosyltransferase family 4 protein n=1 Tax=uncultured Hoeflea sp. TaxID=538666 RepID=UPI0030EDA56F|tara:strand:+ start:8030 stop:9100 length:1071 start_codon:yes stop_codon:yes gene_type:complete